MGHARSPFRDFESFLRIVIGLDEDAVQLILNQLKSYFVPYKISPGIYTIKDFSEAVLTKSDHEGTIQNGYYDISMKTKLTLPCFGLTFGTLKFGERSLLKFSLGFTPFWDYKPTNAVRADSPEVYTSGKILNSSTKTKNCPNCNGIEGSVVNGLREPILFSFV